MEENKNARRLEKLVATPANLAGLVDYQEGAVVSRIVIGKSVGTVTLFAFDEGQTLSEHTTPFDALVCALDGKAEFAVSGKPHLLQAGDAIILPANESHSVRALTKFKMLLVMIRS
jgi:quercetin dioxygenase-like cupin family protein